MTRLLTVKEVATALHLHEKTIARMIARRQIEVVRPGGLDAVRIRDSEVERIINEGITPRSPIWTEKRYRR